MRGLLGSPKFLYATSLGDGSASEPTLLAGSWGGALRAGRHSIVAPMGVPNNQLLVSVQQAFGVESNAYGQSNDASILSGALDLS